MFYISSKNGDKLGVTDTNDNVEEFYTKAQLANFFRNNNIRINGFTYTGSDFKIEVKSISLIKLEQLEDGDVFYLDGKIAIKIEELGERNFSIYCNGKCMKLLRRDLANNKYKINLKSIPESEKIAIIKEYINYNPTGILSYRLREKYNI